MREHEYGAYAVWGKPLPYYQFGSVSSMEYAFVPLWYWINLAFVGLLAALIVGLFRRHFRKWIGLIPALAVGILLAALCALEDNLFLASAVPELTDGYGPIAYWELRPVSAKFVGPSPYDCTPGPWAEAAAFAQRSEQS